MDNKTYIDLGLPSGTLWSDTNEEGYYTFGEAVAKFGDALPTKEDFQELYDRCDWLFDIKRRGMRVIGPNGNSIFLPVCGHCFNGVVRYSWESGYYWSSSVYDNDNDYAHPLFFSCWHVTPDNTCRCHNGFGVRLIKR